MNFIDNTIERVRNAIPKPINRMVTIERETLTRIIRAAIRESLRESFVGNFGAHSLEFHKSRLNEIEHRRKQIDPPDWESRDNIVQGTRTNSDTVASVIGSMFADELGQAQATLNAEFAGKAPDDIDDLISYCRQAFAILEAGKIV